MLDVVVLASLLANCVVPDVSQDVMKAVVQVESAGHLWAIGIVDGRLPKQPDNFLDAVATADRLAADGWNYSIGLAQINKTNFERFKLDHRTGFSPCQNLKVGSQILRECLDRAETRFGAKDALPYALSCYYSGNFSRGFVRENSDGRSYVERVSAALPPTLRFSLPASRPVESKLGSRGVTKRFDLLDLEPMMY